MADPTSRSEALAGEADGRAYYDIVKLLERGTNFEARVVEVLGRLGSLVPYDECAVLQTRSGEEPRIFTSPGTSLETRAALTATTVTLLAGLTPNRAHSSDAPPVTGAHLAVPLVSMDDVLGVLFVRRAGVPYEERHLHALTVVAAELAAYLSRLQGHLHEAELTRQLAEARRTAEAADRAKDEFLALVSHELRTPLSSILAWVDALRAKDTSEADRRRAVTSIERSVRVQAKLISNLLDLSSASAAALRLDLRAVEPAKLIKETLRRLQPQATEKAIRLDIALDESITPVVADPARLGQIVDSLVTNAIQSSPDGGTVEVRLERAGTQALLRVVDSGAGISAEVLPTLFEPFNARDRERPRMQGGLGVGLALVKDLVELHGGSVRAESAGVDKGAVFTVELPLAEATRTPKENRGARRATGPLAGVRVLLVDDDEDIGEVLQLVLERAGAIVTTVTSAAEAFATLERAMPDVLLSDVAMPVENGYDLMRRIVAHKGENALPAAALSAYAYPRGQGQEEARASGFRMLLAKPIDSDALILAMATLAKENSPTRLRERAAETRLQ